MTRGVKRGSRCRSGCLTRDHRSWGECARSANIAVDGAGIMGADRKLGRELARYRAADDAGLNPEAPTHAAVDKAMRDREALEGAKKKYGVS